MAGDCCTTCAKYLLCIFNFLFFVVGAVVFSVGIWLVADKNSFIKLARLDGFLLQTKEISNTGVLEQVAYILIAIGAFIFIIAFLGYCGALLENRVLLTTYGLFLIIVVAVQITVIVLLGMYRTQAEDHTRDILQKSIANSYRGRKDRDLMTLTWDLAMSSMQCCGVNNYTDFLTARFFLEESLQEGRGRMVPESCCILQGDKSLFQPADENCVVSPDPTNSYYKKGCYNKLLTLLMENLNLVFGGLVGVAAFQFVAITFSFCLCKGVRQDRETTYYK